MMHAKLHEMQRHKKRCMPNLHQYMRSALMPGGALGATSRDVSFLSICKHALGFAKLREASEATRE